MNLKGTWIANSIYGFVLTFCLQAQISQAQVPPEPPLNFKITGFTESSVTLSWEKPAANPSLFQYKLFRNAQYLTMVYSLSPITYTDEGLTPATAYAYFIKSVDSNQVESIASSTLNVTTRGGKTPSPPTNLRGIVN